jgi:DNA-binding CsgD family transcriptional regulator
VPALARGDAERLLRFIADAESFGGTHPFSGEFLTQLGRLVPADWVGYSDLQFREGVCGGRNYDFERPGDEGFFSGIDLMALTPILKEENPVFLHFRRGGCSAVKISDFLTRRELHRTQMYNLVFKARSLEDSLGVRLPIAPRGQTRTFVFDRGGRDFSTRDRAILDLLQPHLVHLYRAAEAKRKLREALALLETTQTAVVLLEADDRVAYASTAARELFGRFFGETSIRLPDSLRPWLRERRRTVIREPLLIDAGDLSLVVDVVDDALLLQERRRLPPLTPREREILDLVAEGKTNADIAEILWVSPGTVRRHLENVYAKLGVHTRTAAAALFRQPPIHPVDGSG